MLNSKVAELENKIADLKANCDLAIEGRDLEIKDLEWQLQEVVKDNDNYKAENKSLEQQIEKMKCCHNCDFIFKDGNCYYDKECKNKDHRKLRR